MAAPRKYPDELRERATRMAVELRQDPETKLGAIQRVAEQLGMHPETLRNWVRQAEIDGGTRPGTTTAEAQRIAELEQQVRELRRTNEILKTSQRFRRERSSTARSSMTTRSSVAVIVECIDTHRDRGDARARSSESSRSVRPCAEAGVQDRSEQLLRDQDQAALGTLGARRRAG